MELIRSAIHLAERGAVPDFLIRTGIRKLVESRLKEISAFNCEESAKLENKFISAMNESPIALVPELANEQHYEVPAAFYNYCLGEHRKYSSCYWDKSTKTLDQAEALALQLTCEHADINDGQTILELGCGWGSLTLWMARHYPDCQIIAVSNSNSQRIYITNLAQAKGLRNIKVITADMNDFEPSKFGISYQFDRIVSVEMFEHMRNYKKLYGLVASWLKPNGKFFKHIFVHRLSPYEFKVVGNDDWMSQFFFSGGMMPSDDLPLRFQEHLKLSQLWRWDGTHYEKTANAWLQNMDSYHKELSSILAATYGDQHVEMWRNRWRIFFMACAELFGYKNGQEWWVTHYLFEKQAN